MHNQATSRAINKIALVRKYFKHLHEVDHYLKCLWHLLKVLTIIKDFFICLIECTTLCGLALKWVKSYFNERSQFFEYIGLRSTPHKIHCRVLQESILGPLFFMLYIKWFEQCFKPWVNPIRRRYEFIHLTQRPRFLN